MEVRLSFVVGALVSRKSQIMVYLCIFSPKQVQLYIALGEIIPAPPSDWPALDRSCCQLKGFGIQFSVS